MAQTTSECKVCLAQNIRMYVINNTNLQGIYEKLANVSICEESKLHMVCYICQGKLKNCKKFMETAIRANIVLNSVQSRLENKEVVELEGHTHSLCISNLTLVDVPPVDITNQIKIEKSEALLENFKQDDEKDINLLENNDSETENLANFESKQSTDSEDDLPLKSISKRQTEKENVVRVRKRMKHDVTKVGAREIILNKEEQMQELMKRSESLNYLNSPYKCHLCYRGFVDARAFDNHKQKHDKSSGDHECDVCRMRYATGRQLRTHAAAAHGRQYACNKCPHRSHTTNQAREHAKWHEGHIYECQLCGHTFNKPTSYLTHKRKRHPTQHVCHICGDNFVGQHGLLMHISKVHSKDTEASDEPASRRYCNDCSIQFWSVEAWERHMLTSIKHMQDNENSNNCRICGEQLPNSAALSLHLRTHERALRASRAPAPAPASTATRCHCTQCDAHFVNRYKLEAHVKRIHLGLKYNTNMVCEICGKKITSRASLLQHQRTHTGERPYGCARCDKRFADRNQLRIHARTHTGERPYRCSRCPQRFTQRPALTRHYRVHTGAKPYTCQYCAKTFSQSNSMKHHVNTMHLKLPTNRRKPENGAPPPAV